MLGVLVDAIDYDAATDAGRAAARERRPFALTALAVHGVMTGVQDPAHNARLNAFDLVTPDGQPVRWALNLLHGAGLTDRVYGPDADPAGAGALRRRGPAGLPLRLDRRDARPAGPGAAGMFPALKIAGAEPSKFRAARPGRGRGDRGPDPASGARVVLVGLGCPRQEVFAYAMRPLLDMPLLAVGAAFDYHAGLLRKPPPWMQRRRAGVAVAARPGAEAGCGGGTCCSTRPTWPGSPARRPAVEGPPPAPATERLATFAV